MNKVHVDEFFKQLNIEYQKWKENNNDFPFFDLSNQLNGTIFSYSGWNNTSNIRKTTEKDNIIRSMLERSLTEPATIIDVGTYDGLRIKNILEELNPRAYNNIISIKGIDINAEALIKAKQQFQDLDKPFETYKGRIEKLDFTHLGEERKIILYLDNILFNIKDESTIVPFISKKSSKNDVTIIETHKHVNHQLYAENVEQFFVEYFDKSGIRDILGGRLTSTFGEDGKHVYIENLPREIKYKNQLYKFENKILSEFNHKGIIQPTICLGISRTLNNNWYFMWNLINNGFEAPFKEDVQLVKDDILIRLYHAHDKRFFHNLMRRKDDALNAYGGERLDYILRFEEYPKHYDTHPLIGRHADQVEIVEGNYGR